MSAPKRYPAPLGETPHPLISETCEGGEEEKVSTLVFDLIRGGKVKREESHHQDLTKGGRTSARRVGLLVSCQLRGSARRMVSTSVSARCSRNKWRGALGRWLLGSGSVHRGHRTPVHLRSLPMPDNQIPRNTTSKRLNSSTFFDTRRKSHTPG
jgi:hypothetical protein